MSGYSPLGELHNEDLTKWDKAPPSRFRSIVRRPNNPDNPINDDSILGLYNKGGDTDARMVAATIAQLRTHFNLDGDGDTTEISSRVAQIEQYFVTLTPAIVDAAGSFHQALINIGADYSSGVKVWVTPGTYNVTTNQLNDSNIPDYFTLEAIFPGTVTLTLIGGNSPVFVLGPGYKRFKCVGFNLVSDSAGRYLVYTSTNGVADVDGIHIEDIQCTGCALYNSGSFWSTVGVYRVRNLVIKNIVGNRGAVGNNRQFINIFFHERFIIEDCFGTGYQHGIQMWGGDSKIVDGDGAEANERKCKYGKIIGCWFFDNVGSNCWGSMVQYLDIIGGGGMRMGDVGFDFEGCWDIDCVDTTAIDANNGLYTTFYISKNVRFANVYGRITDGLTWFRSGGQCHFVLIYNDTNFPQYNIDTVIENSLFIADTLSPNGTLAKVSQEAGCSENIIVRNCTIRNGRIDLSGANNIKRAYCEWNKLDIRLSQTAAGHLIRMGMGNYNGGEGFDNEDFDTMVMFNVIRVNVAQFAGVAGIIVAHGNDFFDWKHSPRVMFNYIKTPVSTPVLTYGIYIQYTTPRAGASCRIIVGGNTVPEVYVGGGTPGTNGIVIEDSTGTTVPTIMWTPVPNQSDYEGVHAGHYSVAFTTTTTAANTWMTPQQIELDTVGTEVVDDDTGMAALPGMYYIGNHSTAPELFFVIHCKTAGFLEIQAFNPTGGSVTGVAGTLRITRIARF